MSATGAVTVPAETTSLASASATTSSDTGGGGGGYFGFGNSMTFTYQYVVVAIVACVVFSAGVVVIMIRRRRALRYHDGLFWGGPGVGATRLVLDPSGVLVEVPANHRPTERRARKKLGPEPRMWDSEVGEDVESSLDKMDDWHVSSERRWWEDVERTVCGLVAVDRGVRPLAVAIPEHATPLPTPSSSRSPTPKPDGTNSCLTAPAADAPHMDVTVLIAMPDPRNVLETDDDYPLWRPPPDYTDESELPPMTLATTEVPFLGGWGEADSLRPPRPARTTPTPPETQQQGAQGGVRSVRVDGFSRGLLRF